MKTLRMRTGPRIAAAVAASLGAMTLGSLAASSAAHADPAWGPSQNPLVVVGSNTTEDVMDAFSGLAPTPNSGAAVANFHYFTPLSDKTNTYEQVYSWDAVNQATNATDCISTKPGFAPIARPNGSTDGRKALSDQINGVAWSKSSASSCGSVIPVGMLDIGRSSSPPTTTGIAGCTFPGPCLAWVDFAHDALSYAYDFFSGSSTTTSEADHLTNAQLTALFSNTTNGTYTDPSTNVTYIACLPQLGSGTESFFVNNELNGGSGLSGGTTEAENAAKASNCYNFEENGGNTFQSFAQTALTTDQSDGVTPAPTVAVTPFSVGDWIAQNNLVGFDRTTAGVAAGVHMGYIDASSSGQLPYTGTAPNEAPNPTFYSSSLYGRDLFLLVNNAVLNGKATQVSGVMRRIFGYLGTNWATSGNYQSNTTSGSGVICTAPWATTYLSDFGFTTPALGSCGNESLTVTTPGTGA